MAMLDVFNDNAFSTLTLTDAINKVPYVPGRASEVVNWNETSVPTTAISMEEVEGNLALLNPIPRGSSGETSKKYKSTIRTLNIPHYQHDDAILADEVQNIRAFGSENMLQNLMAKVNERAMQHANWKLDPTLEYQRIGAVKGVIVNGDGSTLQNLFTFFGVSQETEVNFALATAANGDLRKNVTQTLRKMTKHMGGTPMGGVHAFCGDEFWDNLVANAEIRESYKNQPEASRLRDSALYQTVDFAGIRWENYRGEVGGTPFIESTKCHLFPVNAPGLWRTAYGPADYIGTVNTPGLPRYFRQMRMENDKGINLESQMNAINYCTRPKVLIKGKMAS